MTSIVLAGVAIALTLPAFGPAPQATTRSTDAGLGQPGATFPHALVAARCPSGPDQQSHRFRDAGLGQPGATYPFADVGLGQPGATDVADGPAAPTQRAVPWRATDIDGHSWSNDTLRGRIVLVDFWATWCAPCLEDLPRLKRLHAAHGPRGLTIIGVSLDRASTRDFRSWLQRHAITWPQVRQSGQYESPLARAFGVEAIPASYLFDRDGRLHAASLRGDALETRVSALLEAR